MKRHAVIMDEFDAQEDDLSDEEVEALMNAQLPVFPVARFTVHRWRHTGIVVQLDLQGESQAPEQVLHQRDLAAKAARALGPLWLRDSGWVAVELQHLR